MSRGSADFKGEIRLMIFMTSLFIMVCRRLFNQIHIESSPSLLCTLNRSQSMHLHPQLLLLVSILAHQCPMHDAYYRLFDSTPVPDGDGTFDCLMDTDRSGDFSFYAFERSAEQLYRSTHLLCRRAAFNDLLSVNNGLVSTFEQLRLRNITSVDLFNWNAPMDVIEDYVAGKEDGIFTNCSESLWFGVSCEYTLDSSENLVYLIEDRFREKRNLPEDLHWYTNGTCYEMLSKGKCSSILCLDWREICDGKIDCSNGIDEEECETLERNQCDQTNEHRCLDGQCVDAIYAIGLMSMECSEELNEYTDGMKNCYSRPDEECENQKCPPLHFSCGDGYCYDGPSSEEPQCRSKRDVLYLQHMPSSSSIIFYSHIHLIADQRKSPSICYNQTLCPYFPSENMTNEWICFTFNRSSNELIVDAKRLMRSCSLLPSASRPCSMFQCHDKSKCFSYHRLSDGYKDCATGEDEYQPNVCSYNLPSRLTCDNGTTCLDQRRIADGIRQCRDGTDESLDWSLLHACANPFSDNCPSVTAQALSASAGFDQICNGILEYLPDSQNNTDESDCLMNEWPCNTDRSHCDQLWNCADGRDELGCHIKTLSSLYCNNSAHFCLDIDTGAPKCLSPLNVNDGHIDCIGSLDERDFCRNHYPHQSHLRYRCRNSDRCISYHYVCDCKQDCPENDDETLACTWLYRGEDASLRCGIYPLCGVDRIEDYEGREDLFCDLEDQRSNQIWRWHQEAKPSTSKSALVYRPNRRRADDTLAPEVIWTCNRGVYVRSLKDPAGFACFCPDYYYGDRCQYQRKRVKLILRLQMISSFNNRQSAYKFVVFLTQTNYTSKTIVDHHQFIYMPRFACLPKVYVPLLYPLREPYRLYVNYSIHVHVFDYETLQHRSSWTFPLKFEFLPLQIVVKRLLVPEMGVTNDAKQVSFPYNPCKNTCSNESRCLGHDVSLARDICLCPIGYTGRRCLISFDPCANQNCSGHGQCQPFNVFRDRRRLFECVCEPGWRGDLCQSMTARISVSLNHKLAHLARSMAFLHVIDLFASFTKYLRFIYFNHAQKQSTNLSFILTDTSRILDGVFIQFYEHRYKFDYYYLLARHLYENRTRRIISFDLKPSQRCLPVNELFKKDMLSQPAMYRVKSYQKPCEKYHHNPSFCFYDDHLMCICNKKDHRTHCFPFQTDLDRCDSRWCNGRGKCVQDHHQCPIHSRCICETCAYGSFCQFTTAGYTLSLDSIIGSHISIATTNLLEQSRVVQIAFGLILSLVVCGIILNLLSICTFSQRETQEVGCGFYLLISSVVGLCTVIVLMCKMILLLTHHQSNVSCALVDYLLKWFSISCEWLNAAVAIERTVAAKSSTQYSRASSRRYSKWFTVGILTFIASMSLLDLFYRRVIVDPLDERAWCVLTLNQDRSNLLRLYSSWNFLSFLIPLIINLVSAIIIILGTFRVKQKIRTDATNQKQSNAFSREHIRAIMSQIRQHKHILIAPIVLAILSLPHLIISFIFVCTKLDEKSIPSLTAYLVGYIPTMAIPFAFVLPSSSYRQAFFASMKIFLVRNCAMNQ